MCYVLSNQRQLRRQQRRPRFRLRLCYNDPDHFSRELVQPTAIDDRRNAAAAGAGKTGNKVHNKQHEQVLPNKHEEAKAGC